MNALELFKASDLRSCGISWAALAAQFDSLATWTPTPRRATACCACSSGASRDCEIAARLANALSSRCVRPFSSL